MSQEGGLALPWRVLMSFVFFGVGGWLIAMATGIVEPAPGAEVAPPFILGLTGFVFAVFGFAPLLASPWRQNKVAAHLLICVVAGCLAALAAWAALSDGEITTSSTFMGTTRVNDDGASEGRVGFAVMAVLSGVLACFAGFAALRAALRKPD